MRRSVLFISLVLTTHFVLSAQARQSTISLVPAKTIAVVNVNWATVRNDPALREMVYGNDFSSIVRQTGIDESRVREYSIFADVTPAETNKMGVIIAGNFRLLDVVKSAENRNWNKVGIGKRTAYRNPSDGSFVLPLRDGLLVAGTRNGVERTAETSAAAASGIATKKAFKAIFAQLGAAAPIRFFMGVPQEYQMATGIGYMAMKKLLGIGFFTPLGLALTAVGLPQSIGLSISSGSTELPMHMIVQTGGSIIGPSRASLAAKGLNFLKATAAMTPTADRDAINGMTFANNGAYLSVRMKMPMNAIPKP